MRSRDRWWATGLAAWALLTGLAYVHSGWLERPDPALLLGSVLAAGAMTAYVYGVWRSRASRDLLRLAAGVLWVAGFVAVSTLPYALRWGSVAWKFSGVPVPADAYRVRRQIDVVRHDGGMDYRLDYATSLPLPVVESFCREGFAANGWTLHHQEGLGADYMPGRIMAFGRDRGRFDLTVWIEDGTAERRVQIRADHDPRLEGVPRLLR